MVVLDNTHNPHLEEEEEEESSVVESLTEEEMMTERSELVRTDDLNVLQVLDFDATLSGMMGALAEIQRKGDSMLGSIR